MSHSTFRNLINYTLSIDICKDCIRSCIWRSSQAFNRLRRLDVELDRHHSSGALINVQAMPRINQCTNEGLRNGLVTPNFQECLRLFLYDNRLPYQSAMWSTVGFLPIRLATKPTQPPSYAVDSTATANLSVIRVSSHLSNCRGSSLNQ